MDYDKDSFLAGIAVGRQLKGWASGGGGGERPIEPINYDMLNGRIDGTLNLAVDSDCAEVISYAFYHCTKLPSVSAQNAAKIGAYAFMGCAALASVHMPAATEIGSGAFDGCVLLDGINAPAVKTISQNAFNGCKELAHAYLPAVETMGTRAFAGCEGLLDINAPNLQEIGSYAFQGCSFEQIDFPAAATIKGYAFYECYALKLAKIPSVTSLESSTFNACGGLERVLIPRVSKFGTNCFSQCGSLVALVLRTVETADLAVPAGAAYQLSSLFGGTPLGLENSGGYFYVPSSAMDKFSASAAWGPYVTAGKFRTIEDYPGILD